MDYLELYLRNVGLKRWINRALDGTELISVVRGGKAKLKGL
jgi:hypothetical protein